ncbi:hypothetical protein FBGL_14885 [Flavobacterium glycines]|uniref:Uncharacterized protein n=1 Tax=Flavobacterium glycines TaxID=551990 RepID=A0A1B9DGS0_9FLAO|nr:hypothetical protein FBGL_14885 [Flavobacterium glycines]
MSNDTICLVSVNRILLFEVPFLIDDLTFNCFFIGFSCQNGQMNYYRKKEWSKTVNGIING